jgi:trk system potassium uptake protein TrkH
MNLRTVARLLGVLLAGTTVSVLLPAGVAIALEEWQSLLSFGITALLFGGIGMGLRAFGGQLRGSVLRREALLVVTLAWFAVPMIGAVPYLLDGVLHHPIDAFFESASGFTTTGATVLASIDGAMSRSMHFWRMQSQWLGGMGIMVLTVAVLPSLGISGKMLFRNESSGAITEGVRPRIRETSVALWKVYIVLTLVLCGLLSMVSGVPLDVALGHAMSTMGSGGFSSFGASVAGFGSPAVEWILTFFMVVAGVNFSLYYLFLLGHRRVFLEDREFRAYAAVVAVATLGVAAVLLLHAGGSVETALRRSAFQVVSVVTTTGFASEDFNQWPAAARTALFLLMFLGGCAGSTAGGLKIYRWLVMVRATVGQLTRTVQPATVVLLRLGRSTVPEGAILSIQAVFFAFMLLAGFSTLLLNLVVPDLETALTASVTCLGNVGPGLGGVGPMENFGWLPAWARLWLAVLMILGRLELFTVLVLFAPAMWRR